MKKKMKGKKMHLQLHSKDEQRKEKNRASDNKCRKKSLS